MPLDLEHGTLEKVGTGGRLTFVRDLKHPREKVWRAITEPAELKVWFPTTIDGDREAGAPLKFVFPFPDAPVLEGKMRVYDPPTTMEFEWGVEDVLRITLEDVEGGTRLTLIDTFDEYGKAARDAGGWHACLDRLTYEIDGVEWPFGDNGRWKMVTPWYLENFPKEATTAPIPDFHPDADEANALGN
ncbi:MAG: hypothetical protein QOF21_398 [Actinomycetota bacterium]|jgi:uncharacterized protein YndB with AHSA1/START domain